MWGEDWGRTGGGSRCGRLVLLTSILGMRGRAGGHHVQGPNGIFELEEVGRLLFLENEIAK